MRSPASLADLTAGGLAVLLTEQHLDLITAVAHRVSVLTEGRVAHQLDDGDRHADPAALHDLLAIPVGPRTSSTAREEGA
jgi:ABC-type branched-subunit amino acid transport system ATPase component